MTTLYFTNCDYDLLSAEKNYSRGGYDFTIHYIDKNGHPGTITDHYNTANGCIACGAAGCQWTVVAKCSRLERALRFGLS